MTIGDLVGKVLGPESPWPLVLAVALLIAAAGIGRRLFGSLTRQGARLGELERLVESERTRRRQVEAALIDLNVPLPYWPPDGPHSPRPRRRPADDRHDDDQADDDLPEPPATSAQYLPPPVPPLTETERAMAARHRR